MSFIKEAPDSIYFGGGTPSLLEPIRIREIIKACDDTFGRAADREVTLEANPGTVDRDSLKGYRAMGVNRLSLGFQSFDDEDINADEILFVSDIVLWFSV